MTGTSHPDRRRSTRAFCGPTALEAPTVASLKIRVHLIPADAERERQLASLMTACETLRADCERLFRQIAELLQEDALQEQGRARSARPSDLEGDG
jgi:hypothetical protein